MSEVEQQLLGNGYFIVMQEGQALDQGLTDLLVDELWFEDCDTMVLDHDCSFDRITNQALFLQEQVHMMKGLYLYNRHPLLVKWVTQYVEARQLPCEVWVNIGDDCWYAG